MFQQAEVVSLGAKVADMFALIARFTDRHVHFRTGIAVKAIAFNFGGVQIKLGENFAKGEAGGRGSRAAGARDGNHRMFGRHNNSQSKR